MSAAWVAGTVRARAMTRRRVGRAGARRLATAPSAAAAVDLLAGTPYGHDVTTGMTLEEAQRGVAATLLWHMRLLSGWVPPAGVVRLRVMAGWFELIDVEALSRRLAGGDGSPRPPFELGALATAWGRVAGASSPEDLDARLRTTVWGMPADGGSAPVGLRRAWAQRVRAQVPEAAGWAEAAERLLGADPDDARGAAEPAWRAELAWWERVDREATALVAGPATGPGVLVGAVAGLAVDAWRVRAALEVAAAGPGGREVLDAIA